MQLSAKKNSDFYDFYEAAIEWQAQQRMPSVGISIDRRSLRYVNDIFNDDSVYSLVCMVCAQTKTHTGLRSMRVDGQSAKLCDIQYRVGAVLPQWWHRSLEHFNKHFGFRTLM